MIILLWILLTIFLFIPLSLITFLIFTPIFLTLHHSTRKYGKFFSATVSWWNEFLGIGIFRINSDWTLQIFLRKKVIKKWEVELDKATKDEIEDKKKEETKKLPPKKKIEIHTKDINKQIVGKLKTRPPVSKEQIMLFLKRFWKSFALHHLNWKCEYGLGSPAHTGMIYGWTQAINAMLYQNKKINLTFRPDFLNSGYQGNVVASTQFKPYRLIWAFIPFIILGIKSKIKKKKDGQKKLEGNPEEKKLARI